MPRVKNMRKLKKRESAQHMLDVLDLEILDPIGYFRGVFICIACGRIADKRNVIVPQRTANFNGPGNEGLIDAYGLCFRCFSIERKMSLVYLLSADDLLSIVKARDDFYWGWCDPPSGNWINLCEEIQTIEKVVEGVQEKLAHYFYYACPSCRDIFHEMDLVHFSNVLGHEYRRGLKGLNFLESSSPSVSSSECYCPVCLEHLAKKVVCIRLG